MRLALLLAFALLLVVQLRLWTGGHGVAAFWSLEQAVAEAREHNSGLVERNRRLEAEVRDLKEGLDAVEALARRELGMVHRDETYYQFVRR